MNAMSELYVLQVQGHPRNSLGAYVPVPAVNPQVTRAVVYGAVLLVGAAVVFYLLNRR